MVLLKQLASRAVDETNQLMNSGGNDGERLAALFGDECLVKEEQSYV